MPTYKLTIEYEGTRYSGWQVQSNTSKTVQGQLLRAAREVLGEVDLGGGGRTDAGVHAMGQTAHLRTRTSLHPERMQRAINDLLPADIHVRRVENARDNFHARHDATSRVYIYQISMRRTAFGKPFVWWIKDELEPAPMHDALTRVTGMHDFANFTDQRHTNESTQVLVDFGDLAVAGDLILIRLSASHFLWKMVRKLIAAAVEVGRGNLSPDQFEGLLHADEPFRPTAPPSGLFLEAILYDGERFDRALEPVVPVFDYEPEIVAPKKQKQWDAKKKR